MKKYRVVLTTKLMIDHAEYEATSKKHVEKLAIRHFNKKDLYDDQTDMEIEELD